MQVYYHLFIHIELWSSYATQVGRFHILEFDAFVTKQSDTNFVAAILKQINFIVWTDLCPRKIQFLIDRYIVPVDLDEFLFLGKIQDTLKYRNIWMSKIVVSQQLGLAMGQFVLGNIQSEHCVFSSLSLISFSIDRCCKGSYQRTLPLIVALLESCCVFGPHFSDVWLEFLVIRMSLFQYCNIVVQILTVVDRYEKVQKFGVIHSQNYCKLFTRHRHFCRQLWKYVIEDITVLQLQKDAIHVLIF
jgi:hypothetical protein